MLMKKLFKLALVATGLMMSATAANAAVTLKEMPTNGTTTFTVGQLYGTSGDLYYFEAPSDGVLTVLCSAGGNPYFLNTQQDGDGSNLEPKDISGGWEYNVNKGVTYYAYDYVFSADAVRTMTATFKADTPTTPVEFPIMEQEWVMGQTYSDFAWKTEGDISGPGLLLTYTPTSNGKLVVTQNGPEANMGHIYTAEWNKKSSFSTYTGVMQTDDGYFDQKSNSVYEFTYTLVQGATYYFYAKNESADPLNSMSATFTSTGVSEDNIAEIGTSFDCYNEIWQFTPTVTGLMYVTISPYNFSIADPNNGSNLVYTDKGHNQKVSCNGMGQDTDSGYQMTYNVKEGETYYFYQDVTSVNVTIDEVVEQELSVTLVNTDPEPGNASWNLDPYSYASGFRYYFSPATSSVGIASATIVYNDKTNNPKTVTLNASDIEFQGGGFSLKIYETLVEMKQNGKSGEMFYVTLNGITLDGETVPVNTTIESDYITPGDGSITIAYYMAPEFKVVNENWPETIYEEWEENDANGKAYVILSNVVTKINEATVTLGNQTWGSTGGSTSAPSADIPYKITEDGTTIEFDFTAIQEWNNPDNLSFSDYTICTIFVTGIEDQYGQYLGETPSIDKKITFSATKAEDPVIAMPSGQIISPEGNKYAADLEYFMVQWNDQVLSQVKDQNLEATLYITDGDSQTVEYQVPIEICPINEESEVNDCLKVEVQSYVKAGYYGTYTVEIPLGLVQNEAGNVNPMTTMSCIILPLNENYTITPAGNKVPQGSQIKVAFEGTLLTINDSAPSIEWANNTTRWSVDGNAIVVDVDPNQLLGEYLLIIPATCVVIDGTSLNGEVNETITVVKGTTGIESLRDENGNLDVYDLNGRKVANPTKGLYIINGRKVVIK